eukprot:365817_1
MTSNSGVFINPFAIPSKKNTTNKPKLDKKPSNTNLNEAIASFTNYNPTLTEAIKPPPITYPNQYYNNNNNNKRTFDMINNNSYNHYNHNNYNHNNYNHNNYNHNNYNNNNKRRKRRKYPNDGGLTDSQYEIILEARKHETEQDISNYIESRKRNYPSKTNVSEKREIINVKTKRGQLLSINEKIMKYQDDTGNKKTPSVLRFLKTPKFNHNIVRKILHKEIEQEYSAILQCFRYIIKTNYFTQNATDYNIGDVSEITHTNTNTNTKMKKTNECVEGDFRLEAIRKDENMMQQEEIEDDIGNEIDFEQCV